MNHDTSTIILETTTNSEFAIVWLHGLGADGHDFVPIVEELNLPKNKGFRFIFPHAPVQPITLNGGMEMRAWYDILGLDRQAQQDEIGIRQSEALIHHLIEHQLNQGIPSEHIFIAGFSQGGAMALHTGIRYPKKLGGILALSTYLPLADCADTERHTANQHTPIFFAHGEFDAVISLELAQLSRERLATLGHTIEWQIYPMAHSVCQEEIIDIARWLTDQTNLAPTRNVAD